MIKCRVLCAIMDKVEAIGAPIWDLLARIYLFYVFMKSGWLKFQDFMDGSWDRVVLLFKNDFKMPFPEIIAPIATISEVLFPILLLVGVFSRFSALVLFALALMIELTYQHHFAHLVWMFLAASIFLKGPGALSIDHRLCCSKSSGSSSSPSSAKGKKR